MKKIRRLIGLLVLLVLILVVGSVAAFHLWGTKAIKYGIETGGSRALQVPVALEDVSLSLLAGQAGMKNLVIDNPAGYQHAKLLQLGKAEVHMQLRSVLTDTVLIDSILLEDVDMVLEQKGLSNNIKDILHNLPSGDSDSEEPSGPGKDLQVSTIELRKVKVNVKLLPIPGKADTLRLELAPIVIKDVGTKKKVDMVKLTGIILVALAEGIVQQGGGVLPADLLRSLEDQVAQLTALTEGIMLEAGTLLESAVEMGKDMPQKILKQGSEVLEEQKKNTEKMLDDTKKIGDDLQKGIGGLLKPKEEKEDK
ncbi:MAG: hypothetical protein JW810_10085 [Sedimentisphaerales bacterium]|nr:hypothetical protein [Sedimentisphaerales bacterium]